MAINGKILLLQQTKYTFMYNWPAKRNKKESFFSSLGRYIDFYSENDLFKKIKGWSVKVGMEILFYALILFYVLSDEKVTIKNKLVIMGALGYFILPTDIISDFIPVLGFTDDAAFLSFALMSVSNSITPEIKEKAKKKLEELVNETVSPEILSNLPGKKEKNK